MVKRVTDTPSLSIPHNTKKELEPEEREEKVNNRPARSSTVSSLAELKPEPGDYKT